MFVSFRARDKAGIQCWKCEATDAHQRERSEVNICMVCKKKLLWCLYQFSYSFTPLNYRHDSSILWRLNFRYNSSCAMRVCVGFHYYYYFFFRQQRWTPAQRSYWGSCRRRGPVRCAWTNWCPSSSSPVVIWWCVAIVLPACVTAPSAELSLEAAFVLSCLKAEVKSHCYTGVVWLWVPLYSVFPCTDEDRKDYFWLIFFFFCQRIHIMLYNKHFKLFNMPIVNAYAVRFHFTNSKYDNKIIKRAHSFINKHLFTWSHSTVWDK